MINVQNICRIKHAANRGPNAHKSLHELPSNSPQIPLKSPLNSPPRRLLTIPTAVIGPHFASPAPPRNHSPNHSTHLLAFSTHNLFHYIQWNTLQTQTHTSNVRFLEITTCMCCKNCSYRYH